MKYLRGRQPAQDLLHEALGESTRQKLYCHLPINEDKFAASLWSILIYINSLSGLIMGTIKLHPEENKAFDLSRSRNISLFIIWRL